MRTLACLLVLLAQGFTGAFASAAEPAVRTGTIEAIDISGRRIEIADKSGQTKRIRVYRDAKITLDGMPVTLKGLATGQTITATLDAKGLAARVEVVSPKANTPQEAGSQTTDTGKTGGDAKQTGITISNRQPAIFFLEGGAQSQGILEALNSREVRCVVDNKRYTYAASRFRAVQTRSDMYVYSKDLRCFVTAKDAPAGWWETVSTRSNTSSAAAAGQRKFDPEAQRVRKLSFDLNVKGVVRLVAQPFYEIPGVIRKVSGNGAVDMEVVGEDGSTKIESFKPGAVKEVYRLNDSEWLRRLDVFQGHEIHFLGFSEEQNAFYGMRVKCYKNFIGTTGYESDGRRPMEGVIAVFKDLGDRDLIGVKSTWKREWAERETEKAHYLKLVTKARNGDPESVRKARWLIESQAGTIMACAHPTGKLTKIAFKGPKDVGQDFELLYTFGYWGKNRIISLAHDLDEWDSCVTMRFRFDAKGYFRSFEKPKWPDDDRGAVPPFYAADKGLALVKNLAKKAYDSEEDEKRKATLDKILEQVDAQRALTWWLEYKQSTER